MGMYNLQDAILAGSELHTFWMLACSGMSMPKGDQQVVRCKLAQKACSAVLDCLLQQTVQDVLEHSFPVSSGIPQGQQKRVILVSIPSIQDRQVVVKKTHYHFMILQPLGLA